MTRTEALDLAVRRGVENTLIRGFAHFKLGGSLPGENSILVDRIRAEYRRIIAEDGGREK
jgi:hypothetical protein